MDDKKYWKNHSLLPRSCWSLESSEATSLDYRRYCWRRCSSLARRQHVAGGKRCLLAVKALSYIPGVPPAQCPHSIRGSYGRRGRGMALSAQGLTGRILRWLSSYGVQMKWLRNFGSLSYLLERRSIDLMEYMSRLASDRDGRGEKRNGLAPEPKQLEAAQEH